MTNAQTIEMTAAIDPRSIPTFNLSTSHSLCSDEENQSDDDCEYLVRSGSTLETTSEELDRILSRSLREKPDTSIWEDWSGSGSHVDYGPNDALPLENGRYLGRGAAGDIYEVRCRGMVLAVKRKFCRKRVTEAEKKEVEIMRKLSHPHVVDVVGTFTQGRILGILLYPVAICDLAMFFDDVESVYAGDLDPIQTDRLSELGLPPVLWKEGQKPECAFLFSKIGCLTGALKYLHKQRVLHRDLKPSNILLSRRKVWLTDFGYSVDFSARSTSQTESGGRGTPKYSAPEVAKYLPSGRAADIFSLGCVLLEILSVCLNGSLAPLKALRPIPDHYHSFQANLHQMPAWSDLLSSPIPCYRHLLTEVTQMLAPDPQIRPTAHDLFRRLSYIDQFNGPHEPIRIFDECCRTKFYSDRHHHRDIKRFSKRLQDLADEHNRQLHEMKKRHQIAMGKTRSYVRKRPNRRFNWSNSMHADLELKNTEVCATGFHRASLASTLRRRRGVPPMHGIDLDPPKLRPRSHVSQQHGKQEPIPLLSLRAMAILILLCLMSMILVGSAWAVYQFDASKIHIIKGIIFSATTLISFMIVLMMVTARRALQEALLAGLLNLVIGFTLVVEVQDVV